MKKNLFAAFLFLSLQSVQAFAEPLPETDMPKITKEAQQDLTLSVFNDGLALVREVRKAELGAGNTRLKFTDVPVSLIPESVRVRSLSAPGDFSVAEQGFEQNTADARSLLDQFVGKKIKIVNWNQYQDRKEVLDATLLSNDGEAVYEINGEIYIGYPGTRILPEVPKGFVLKPALVWNVWSKEALSHEIEVSYLASALQWQVDYILLMDAAEGPAELTAWATISNHSGIALRGAGLRLVAGQVNRTYAEPPMMYAMAAKRDMAMAENAAAPSPSFQHQSMFEYHAYDLSERIDLENNSRKQVQFFQPKNVTLEKEYRVEAPQYYYGQPYYENAGDDAGEKQPVQVHLKMKNEEGAGLGVPMPEGVVRLYQRGPDGRQTFAGEDRIPHAPKGETIRLQAGQAFDVTARRKQADYKQLAANTFESEWQVTLKNAKDKDVEVLVREPMSGSWQVVSESQSHEKINANTIQYKVKVPKNGEAVLKYRVRTGY